MSWETKHEKTKREFLLSHIITYLLSIFSVLTCVITIGYFRKGEKKKQNIDLCPPMTCNLV